MMRLILIVSALGLLSASGWARTTRSHKSHARTTHGRAPARARTARFHPQVARARASRGKMARPPARGVRVAQIAHPAVSRAPASFHTGVVESDKSLKVMGQSRSINMTLVLKGEKDEIHFVKPRTSFQDKLGEDRF